ncbi:hypothetical protein TIFTF001_021206 [Ficus carica]|uniref:Uncharacterized protein n=1 Tax=Ficus carica TaxID=3494 RepID=A0AA88DEC7_FICCA|nr:hypothetical protein TIFTF001_021206 [Ficus carica]
MRKTPLTGNPHPRFYLNGDEDMNEDDIWGRDEDEKAFPVLDPPRCHP